MPATSVTLSPAPVLASCALGVAALVADAASGRASLTLVGVALMVLSLGLASAQAAQAGVGRPARTSRLAARAATAASLFVAAFLASVGVLERGGPEVTGSAVFAAGVTVMSLVLLVVLPLALLVLGRAVAHDRRLDVGVRALPWTLLVVVVCAVVAGAVTDGGQERWLQVVAAAAAGAVLTGFSTGLSRAATRLS